MTSTLRTKGPVLLSTLVCPGAGQILQGRWGIGALFVVSFLVPLVMLLVTVVGHLVHNLNVAFAYAEHTSDESFQAFPVRDALCWLALCLAVYGGNVIDVVRAAKRGSSPPSRRYPA